MAAHLIRLAAVVALLLGMPTLGKADTKYQILALIAHPEGVVLDCAGEVCTATLSAFCLQKDHATPARGMAYRLLDPTHIAVHGSGADGAAMQIAGRSDWRFLAQRDQLAVRVEVPRRVLAQGGLTRAAITVAPGATLVPATADAIAPDDAEIALLRQVGSRLVDEDRSRMGAVRVLARLSNELPAGGATDAQGQADELRLLQAAMSPDATGHLSDAAQTLARQQVAICQTNTDLGAFDSLQRCFEVQHDSILWTLNVDYWLAFDSGS